MLPSNVKGSIFEIVYRRLVPRLGHNKTIGAIAHRICQLIWIILHKGVRYEERGPAVSKQLQRARTSRMIRTLSKLGYRVEPIARSGMSNAIFDPGLWARSGERAFDPIRMLLAQLVPLGGWFLPMQNRTSICCLGLRRAFADD